MVPRGTLDIGWRDLALGLLPSVVPGEGDARVDGSPLWTEDEQFVALSVRSGFDLVLQELALEPGSEVLTSAVTIPDMLRILAEHRLVAVPIDVDFDTLSVDEEQLAAAVGRRTRAVLVAHLFGSRMRLEPLVALAERHGLTVIEDCAQAFDGSYAGHPGCDVSLFSFGPIKTATALGGAVVRVRDRHRLARLRAIQAAYPCQTRRTYAGRIARFGALKTLSCPWLYGPLVATCRRLGIDHDALIAAAARGFPGERPMERFRRRPSAALEHLLARRLRQSHAGRIAARMDYVRRVVAQLPEDRVPGLAAAHHAHWVLPFASNDPDGLVRQLWAAGFDATRKASSLVVVAPVADHPRHRPLQAQRMLDHLVYLPMAPSLPDRALARMTQLIRHFEAPARPFALSPIRDRLAARSLRDG